MIKIELTVNFEGKTISKEIPNFPENVDEAVSLYGADKVFEMFARNMVIHEQAKLRQEYRDVRTVLPNVNVDSYYRATVPTPVKRKVTRKRKPVRKTARKTTRKSKSKK